MTDLVVGQVTRETLDATGSSLRVGLVVRETLMQKALPPTDLQVGLTTRETLLRQPIIPLEMAVALVTRETLLVPDYTKLQLTDIEIIATSLRTDDYITLRWSDDLGCSWQSNGILRSLGQTGEYLTSPTWYRLGMSRRRIFELSWSAAKAEALQGVVIEVEIANS